MVSAGDTGTELAGPSAGCKAHAVALTTHRTGSRVHGNSSGPLCVLIRHPDHPSGKVAFGAPHPSLLGSLLLKSSLWIGPLRTWEWSPVPSAPADTGNWGEQSGPPVESEATPSKTSHPSRHGEGSEPPPMGPRLTLLGIPDWGLGGREGGGSSECLGSESQAGGRAAIDSHLLDQGEAGSGL